MGNDIRAIQLEALAIAEELERRRRFNKITTYYPDTGAYRRDLYKKHLSCFAAGEKFSVRAVMGANRCGKTEGIGCYETVLHMTGRYPSWWTGKRFKKPIVGLTVAREPKILRRGVQRKLFGLTKFGEALYPLDCLDKGGIRLMPNGNGAYEFAPIKHVSGGWSEHLFGTYKQGREGFESIELDWFHEDEEAPEDIHDEIVMRTMTTGGCGILTYTPLKGLTPLTERIWTHKDDTDPDVHVTNITWDDVPHLTEEQKADYLRKTPGYLRDARSKGIPASGVGRIYPVDPKEYTVAPFTMPDYWPRVFGADLGFHCTAVLWGAHDLDSDTVYIYSEHYKGEAEVPTHAAAIKARGVWIPGVGDAAGTSQINGDKFIELYRDNGVRMRLPNKAVDAGIAEVLDRLATGRLKIWNTCQNLLKELLGYSYDEKQKVIKANDHACDALRYLIVSGLDIAARKRPENTLPKIEELRFY